MWWSWGKWSLSNRALTRTGKILVTFDVYDGT